MLEDVAADTEYADGDLIALTNNGLLYLFSSLKLTLAGQTVVNYPGQATSLLGLASYSSEYHKGWWNGTRLVSRYQQCCSC